MFPTRLSQSLDRIDHYFLAGVAQTANRDHRRIAKWFDREAMDGDSLIDSLVRRQYLVPHSRRIVEASAAGAHSLPSPRQLFTPAGMEWLDEHLPGVLAEPPKHIFQTAPGVWFTDADSAWAEMENVDRSGGARGTDKTVGSYRLTDVLGSLSNNTMYSGESLFGGDRMALKLIPTEGIEGAESAERFLNGAKVTRKLNLPGILPVHSFAREFGIAFLTMPLVEAGSLQDLHERNRLAPAAVSSFCAQAARLLESVHAQGFAHGNVKTGNLLMGANGLMLSDFAMSGAARKPWSAAASQLQKADVAALLDVYAGLLDGPLPVPSLCHKILQQNHPTVGRLADALDSVANELNSRRTFGSSASRRTTISEVGPLHRVPQIGDVLGKCHLNELIGEGATGVVFRATHQTLDISVAVKVFGSIDQCPEKMAARFMAEARMLAKLSHPNILRILDCECGSDLPPFLVLEFIDGQNLETRIDQLGEIPANDAVTLFTQVVAGLSAAYSQSGLVHRDIKPANILLGGDGTVKVADFGLSSFITAEKHQPITTAGTPAYMAPEQVSGETDGDHRSDIYSLGVTMYQAVVGDLPFTGETTFDVMFRHAHDIPVAPNKRNPNVPTALSAVIMKMLAKKPEDRFQTYDELHTALVESLSKTRPSKRGTKSDSHEGKKASLLRRLFVGRAEVATA